MKDLEKLKDDILGICKDKFDIFYSEPILTSERKNYIVWGGEDFKDFLSLAEKLNVKLIYFCGAPIYDEEDLEHHGKIGQIEVGFLYNDIFHVFVQAADWFVEDVEDVDEDDEDKIPQEILDKTVDELSNEMIQFLQREYKNLTEIYKNLRQLKSQFWLDKEVEKWKLDPKTRMKIEKIEDNVEKYFLDLMREKEKEILPKLIEDCIEWCKNQGLTKVTKTNINLFLNENDATLTSIGNDALYLKVNHELKKK